MSLGSYCYYLRCNVICGYDFFKSLSFNSKNDVITCHISCHSKATVTKTVWYCQKNRQIDEWERIHSPEIGSHKYSQLIFDKEQKHFNGAKIVFSTNRAGTADHSHAEK